MSHDDSTAAIPRRQLGSTGADVSILCLGGFHLGVPPKDEAIRIIHRAVDAGMDFLDNAWEYNDRESERRMGEALAQGGYRDRAFLMSKNCAHDRRADTSMRRLEESLELLRTDRLDLWQIHEVTWHDDPDRIFAPGGAAEAMLKAKEQGKVRFIGFTGHKSPAIFKRMLALAPDFPWDTVQMPVNALDAHFDSFQQQVIPPARARGIGVIGMKSLAAGRIPTETDITAEEAIRYALSQDVDAVCVGVDSLAVLEQDLRVGRGFVPLTAAEQADILERAYPHGWNGRHERFKVSLDFEGGEAQREHGLAGAAAD